MPIVPWLIRQAAAQAAQWHDTFGPHAPFVRIDLPDRLVADATLVQHVVVELRRHRFPPGLLHLGMSESSIIDQHGEPCTELVELTGQGIRLVLNGLGATVRHFHLLPEFLLHGVTISPLLTAELDVIPRQCEKSVLQAMIELGRNLNLEVSVLGINTPHHNDLARHFGASTVEGLAIGAPRTAQTMEALLTTDDRTTNPRTHQSS